ncbi:MAG: flagellar biosynthetic protein FliR [Sphingomonadales bacterium]
MLSDLLTAEVFTYFLVFMRTAAMLSLMPAIGETNIPARVRLALALVLTVVMVPIVGAELPPRPAGSFALAWLVITEILIGLFVGLTVRLMMSALHLAGTIIAFQSGLAAAQSFDPSQGSQSALVSRFFSVLGVVAIFAANLHHVAIKAMAGTYFLFTPGAPLPLADATQTIISVIAHSFALGLQLSAPFLVYGMIFNIALGLLARLMPQIQVFFIAMPANILLSFLILMFTISAMMLWFLTQFESQLSRYLL